MVLQVAEISRILKPGGVFVGSTYIIDGPFSFMPFLGTQIEVYSQFVLIFPSTTSGILLGCLGSLITSVHYISLLFTLCFEIL